MNEMYAQYNADITKGDTSLLKDVHVYSSGLKSYCTKLGADGIEEARRCLGGHGFSLFSGMIDFHRQFLATVTYEGENALLTVSDCLVLLGWQHTLLLSCWREIIFFRITAKNSRSLTVQCMILPFLNQISNKCRGTC